MLLLSSAFNDLNSTVSCLAGRKTENIPVLASGTMSDEAVAPCQ